MTRRGQIAVPLPDDGPVRIGHVQLPDGRRLSPSSAEKFGAGPAADGPVLWATRSVIDAPGPVWRDLHEACGPGLVPVLLVGLHAEDGRPWDSGEFAPPAVTVVDRLTPDAVLRDMWTSSVPDSAENEETGDLLHPFGAEWPGLAEAQHANASPSDLEMALVSQGPARVALVVAGRAADVPAVVGWGGASKHLDRPDAISSVLRSWEERFGAKLLELGFDTIKLFVERPPITLPSALAVAAEQFALCSGIVYQGAGSVRELAHGLVGANIWCLGWD